MIKKYLFIAVAGLLLTSCTEDTMDNINKDEQHPVGSDINAKFQITDAITSTAFTTLGGNYAWYVSSYTEQEFGTGNNQLMKAELRNASETAAPSTFNNEWNGTYANMLNIKQIMQKCQKGGLNENQYDLLGMAQTLMAINLGVLTDLHGDIPYTEAIMGSGNKTPKLDKQEAIYDSIQSLLNHAVTNLTQGANLTSAGSQDLLFNNNNKKWLGLAHALKARYLLHTLGRNPSVLTDVIAEANAAVAAGFDGSEFSIFNGNSAVNSWTSFFWSRQYTGSSTTVANLMNARNDNRVKIYNYNMFGKNMIGVPGTQAQAVLTTTLNAPSWLDNGSATIHVFSKAELYFILAEAKARSGQDANSDFATAIKASFADYQMNDAYPNPDSKEYSGFVNNADEYITSLAARFSANPLAEIMVQKYIAQARDEQIEAYNDMRRCMYVDGSSFVKMTNPNNTNALGNQWPYRLPYGQSDVTSNPNVSDAFGSGNNAGAYLFTEMPWIYGGTR